MGDGALTPASADDTWRQRLGDCKAKTVLLLALLDGLGIQAEPAAVSIDAGDGMDERLPMMSAFDHVLVRATIAGEVYWLDGARTGDRTLTDVTVPAYHWALPLTGANAALEELVVPPLSQPTIDNVVVLDASAGLQTPAAVTGTLTLRGDTATVLGGPFGLLSPTQKDETARSVWTDQLSGLTITKADAVYDAETNLMTFTVQGSLVLDWKAEGLIPPGSTYSSPATAERPAGVFKDTPYRVEHPEFTRSEVTVKLPQGGEGFRTSGGEVDLTELGYHVRRKVQVQGDAVVIEVTMRSLVDEVTAADAERARVDDAARPWSPPRIFAPQSYRTTDADRAAMTADTPTTADGWLDRAFALSAANDYAGAAQAADQAVTLAPEDSNAWANRGVYRLRSGDRENAESDLAKAADLDPSDRIAMNGHAMIAMMDRRYQDAVVEMSRALRQEPGNIFALATRAQAYAALKQYDRALRDVDAMIASLPNEVQAKLMRAALLTQAGRNAEAETELDALAQADPENREILLTQATNKLEVDKPEAALEIVERALPMDEAKPESALMVRAKAYGQLGRLDDMARDMAAVREFSTESGFLLNNLCFLAAEMRFMLDQALADCDAALDIWPGQPAILDSRGLVLLQQGDAEGAMANYQAALAADPNLAPSLYGRGLARIALGETAAGEVDKAAAIAIDPTIARTFRNYQGPETSPQTP